MIKKLDGNIVIALCTASAMIAYAFYERYGAPILVVPQAALFGAAAGICLLPVLYAIFRRKTVKGCS